VRKLDTLALVLTIVGGLNWGLVGLFGFDLVAAIFGGMEFACPPQPELRARERGPASRAALRGYFAGMWWLLDRVAG
jgi:hypothetical protein